MVSRPVRPTPPPQTLNQMRSTVANEYNKAIGNRPGPMPEPPRPPVKNVSPQRPNVMGSPDKVMPTKAGPRVQQAVNMDRGLTMGPRVQQAVDMERGLTGGAQVQRGVDMMNKAMNNAQQFSAGAAQNIGNKVKGFFKKGGKVAAKAPVKKAAGGKVMAKGRKK